MKQCTTLRQVAAIVTTTVSLLMVGCSEKPRPLCVRTTPPLWLNSQDTPIEFPLLAGAERAFQDSIKAAQHALSAALWHSADTLKNGDDSGAVFYTTRIDLLEQGLRDSADGFITAKKIAKAMYRFFEHRVSDEFYDQLYITFCKAPSIDSFRAFVFIKCPRGWYKGDSSFYFNKGIADDTAQAYITTRLLFFRKLLPDERPLRQRLQMPPR